MIVLLFSPSNVTHVSLLESQAWTHRSISPTTETTLARCLAQRIVSIHDEKKQKKSAGDDEGDNDDNNNNYNNNDNLYSAKEGN